MLNGSKGPHSISHSSGWGVKKPSKYDGTEHDIAGMAEVSNR